MTDSYQGRPWVARYDPGQPTDLDLEFRNALEMFAASVRRSPDAPAIRYFDGLITLRELDVLSSAFAVGLLDAGVTAGDRVALYLQNIPQFVVAALGAWKAGCIAVPVNPMSRHRELELILRDSGATALVCLQGLYAAVAATVIDRARVRLVITTSELDYQSRGDPRVFCGVTRLSCAATADMTAFLSRFRGQPLPPTSPDPDAPAFLTYTSGTTGPPKGAINTHRNVVFSSQTYRQWCRLGPGDVVLGVSPLFHITGLIAHIGTALLLGAPLVLSYRFEPTVVLDEVRDKRCTFTVASITVFIALLNTPGADREALASLGKIWSGGAPIPPSIVTEYRARFGHYIHNVYGLTETTSPSHAVPFGAEAPIDERFGALSVGVPVYGTTVRVIDDDGREVPPGQTGELVTSGPQVVPGYWNKPEETAAALPEGTLRTGDVGYMDEQGWFYLVDRKKEQINAGGYKIWPREVEDVLYEHSGVREAAVVGVPDPYRGETVKAFVSLRAGRSVQPADLIAFCKERLAAYKCPRQVEIRGELPKTATGKILRRELRGDPGMARPGGTP
jgi:long-chain acyl-CoA synthetase